MASRHDLALLAFLRDDLQDERLAKRWELAMTVRARLAKALEEHAGEDPAFSVEIASWLMRLAISLGIRLEDVEDTIRTHLGLISKQ